MHTVDPKIFSLKNVWIREYDYICATHFCSFLLNQYLHQVHSSLYYVPLMSTFVKKVNLQTILQSNTAILQYYRSTFRSTLLIILFIEYCIQVSEVRWLTIG